MAVVVNVHTAKTNLSRLLRRVSRGEEIILARAGKPCAKLVPLDEEKERTAGLLKGWRLPESFFEPLPDEELDTWER
ncbi:MAG: type II toxin-antitoxin system prevent-host-death family antitoxin [Dehalococcoidia bacterium]|nr:type II toxin-antitoxin system prevent-host-death family antitoxin [Dehalococcoidia bacterium]